MPRKSKCSASNATTADVKLISGVIDSCANSRSGISSERQQFIEQIDQIEQQVHNKAEEFKRAIDRQKETHLSELKTVKEERLRHVDRVTYDIEQHMSLLKSLKQYSEELCRNGAASDIGRETQSLHQRTNELLKLGDLQRTVDELRSVAV